MKKSIERLEEERLLIEYGLLEGKQIYNPITNRDIQATRANISRIYNILLEDIRQQEIRREQRQPVRVQVDFNELVSGDRKYVININLNGGLTEVFMLNMNTVEQIDKLINQGFREEVKNEYGSDAIFRANIIGIVDYTITEIKATHRIDNKDGSFFNFKNETSLDLTKYQILREEDDNNILEEQCLLYSLKQLGINEAYINSIKLAITNKAIPKKDLEIICDIIHKKIILYSYKTDNVKTTKQEYGKKYNETLEIALYLNHYFVYEKTQYNKCFINNYNELKNIENCNNIIKIEKVKDKKYYKYGNNKCNSLYLIHRLSRYGFFKENSYKLSQVIDNSNYKSFNIPLDNIEEEQREYNYKKPHNDGILTPIYDEEGKASFIRIKKINILFFGDTETIVKNGEHQILKLGIVGEEDNKVQIFNADTPWINQLFNYVKKRTPQNIKNKKQEIIHNPIIYFHNLKYDFVASFKKNVECVSGLVKDGQIFRIIIKHFGFEIELRDSAKLVTGKLADFTNTFNLDKDLSKKEAINYKFYDLETLKTKKHNVIDYIKDFDDEKKKIFFNAMTNKDFEYDGETFNADYYYDYYLKYDCLILKAGLIKLKKILLEVTGSNGKEGLNVFDYLTISSIAHNYMLKNGAYNGVCEVKGNVREFISRAIYGGRVNVYEPIKCQVLEPEGGISDFDGVSLYPSAMDRLCKEAGLPIGKAEIINDDYLTKNYFIVKIRITKINKKQRNPFIAIRGNDNIKYINEITEPTIVYVDKYTLEDYIKFHEIEYIFIQGIYWDNSYNDKLGFLINELFESRREYKNKMSIEKKENGDSTTIYKGLDALQNIVKLIMNSSYGKSMIRKTNEEIKYINKNNYNRETKKYTENNELLNNYIYNNFNKIISYKEMNDKQVELKQTKMDDTFNFGHVGSCILSYSKRIMNEVMNVASNNDINIYYQDTDSMHLNFNDINKLANLYKIEYKKELIGEDLGEFHTDFKLKNSIGEVISKKSIFLGKKSYIDVLQGNDKLGNIINGFHYRMKGATDNSIKYEVNKNCGGDYFTLYNKLSRNIPVDFILNPYNEKVMFEYTKSGVRTRKTGDFIRTIKF